VLAGRAVRERKPRRVSPPSSLFIFFTWFTSENRPREGCAAAYLSGCCCLRAFSRCYLFCMAACCLGELLARQAAAEPAALVLRPCGCAHHSGRPLLRLLSAPPVSRSRVSSVPPRLAAPMEHRAAAWSRFERRPHGFDRKFSGFPAPFHSNFIKTNYLSWTSYLLWI